jgi:hypothetical protein
MKPSVVKQKAEAAEFSGFPPENSDWRSTLSRWHPGMEERCDAKAA